MKLYIFLKNKWDNYWFSENMLFNAGMARIFIGISALWNVFLIDSIDFHSLLNSSLQSNYQPIGILQLFGNRLPTYSVFVIVRLISYISTCCFLLGLFSRLSNFLSVVSGLFIISFVYSWGSPWSHGENVIYLAQIAMLLTPCGAYFSLDALFFKNKDKLSERNVFNTGWGLQLAIFSIAFIFVNAGYYKINQSPFLGWIFSDNLRNYIIEQYLITFQKPLPAYLEWIVNHEAAYKLLAFMNIAVQLSFCLIVFFIRKPVLRMVFAFFFICECLGLYYVMGLNVFKWIPLAFVFIDWSWLLKKNQHPQNTTGGHKLNLSYLVSIIFIVLFCVVYGFTAFDKYKRMEKKYKVYPFSDFSLFTEIHAKYPLNKHQTMQYNGNIFQINADPSESTKTDNLAKRMARDNYGFNGHEIYDTTEIKLVVEAALKKVSGNIPIKNFHSIEWLRIIYFIPAYPERAELKVQEKGLIGKIEADKSCKIFTLDPVVRYGKTKDTLHFFTAGYKGVTIKKIQFVRELSEIREEVSNWSVKDNIIEFSKIGPGTICYLITIADKETGKEEVYSKLIHIWQ